MNSSVEEAVQNKQRVAALHALGLLDTPAEQAFDRLSKLAARILNAPVALVSLVDRERQFFKSCLGLPEPWSRWRETPLSHSFCQHVVAKGEPLVITDARRDPGLLDNLAIRDLNVIAYLGSPLVLPGGEVIGSFCVIDSKPRVWTDAEIATVRDISGLVMTEISLRQARKELELVVQEQAEVMTASLQESAVRYQDLLESSLDLHCTHDLTGKLLKVNQRACETLGYRAEELIGRNLRDLLVPEVSREFDDYLTRIKIDGRANGVMQVRTRNGEPRIWEYRNVLRSAGVPEPVVRGTAQDVSEQHRIERALRMSEQRFRATFEQAAVGIAHTSPVGTFLRVNDKFCGMLGYTRDEMLACKFQDITHPDDLGADVEAVRRLIAGEIAVYTAEKRYLHRDGHAIWARLTASLVRDRRGRPDYFIAVVEDITIHKRDREAIARSEALLAEAQRVAHFGNFEWNVVTGDLIWSRELYRIYGLDPRNFSPTLDGFLAHVHPDDRDKVQGGVKKVLASGEVHSQKERIVRPDGTVRVLDTVITPFTDEHGRISRLMGVCHDITSRERVDEIVKMLARGSGGLGVERFYAGCVRQLAQAYNARYAFIGKLIEPDRKRVATVALWAGDRPAENFSYALEGTPCQDILNLNLELIPNGVAKRYPRDAMLQEMGVDSYFGAPIVGSDGKAAGLVSVMDVRPMDIEPWVRPVLGIFATRLANEFEREERFAERERLLDELTARNVEMENFLYTISHDLKAPLITISGFASLLEKDIAAGDAVRTRDSLGEIQKAVAQMTRHIQDLLLLSRIGHVQEDKRPEEFTRLIESVLDAFAPRLDEAGASVRHAGNLPTLIVDYKGFVRVFNNLIDNAIKYRHAERPLVIEIGVEHAGDEVRLYVRDNGQGIKPEYQAHIFEMFQRADSLTEGAGIGLAISKRVVEQHGGRMWVDSAPGRGSTFWIALPAGLVVSATTGAA